MRYFSLQSSRSKASMNGGSSIYKSRDRTGTLTDLIGSPSHRSTSNCNQPYLTASEEEHHTRLGEHAAALWKYNKITDITVKLRGISYPAHKTVLSCYSKYFKELLLESKGNISVINTAKAELLKRLDLQPGPELSSKVDRWGDNEDFDSNFLLLQDRSCMPKICSCFRVLVPPFSFLAGVE
ncbi:hypothetical protein CDAR_543731 [Caerostris darwini]|uniref:BTB domain-containing protein n=1 Tax=Caerostris darwini TaxID=1538125 RepID=A0AAV4NKE2_9ARAC|nr:hypothetical protein CDAR_543731 [Caerostris darwini]